MGEKEDELTEWQEFSVRSAMASTDEELRACLNELDEVPFDAEPWKKRSHRGYLKIRLGEGSDGWDLLMKVAHEVEPEIRKVRISLASAHFGLACDGGLSPSKALSDVEPFFADLEAEDVAELLLLISRREPDLVAGAYDSEKRRFLEECGVDPRDEELDRQFVDFATRYFADRSRFNRALTYRKELSVTDLETECWRGRYDDYVAQREALEEFDD